jgi:hypothetical protein
MDAEGMIAILDWEDAAGIIAGVNAGVNSICGSVC